MDIMLRTLISLFLLSSSLLADTVVVVGQKPFVSGGGGGTPTWVQDDGATFDPFGTSTRTVTFTSSTTSGNMLIAVYRGSQSANLTVADNKGNTWVECVEGATSGIAIWAAYNITGGSSHNVTFTLSVSNPDSGDIVALEYSGMATSSALDFPSAITGGQASSFVANQSVTTGTLAQAVELLFGACNTPATETAGAGFTMRIQQGSLSTEDRNSASTASTTIGFTHAESNTQVSAATFKAAP